MKINEFCHNFKGLAVHLQSGVWAMALEMDEQHVHVSSQEFYRRLLQSKIELRFTPRPVALGHQNQDHQLRLSTNDIQTASEPIIHRQSPSPWTR
jgi:hypothetical protein